MPLSRKQVFADLLFGFQVLSSLITGISQFFRMLETSQGVSISWFACWEVYLVWSLILAIRSHRAQPSRVTFQTLFGYVAWMPMVTLDLGLILWKYADTWNRRDTITMALVALGVALTVKVSRLRGLPLTDPLARSAFALCFKTAPQLTLAFNMAMLGGQGLAGFSVLAGNLSILTRLGQLWFSIKEAGWDRNRIGLAISEVANEVSWMIVTIVWFVV